MAAFGDIVYESSRAFADDEEEEFQNQLALSFETEHTTSGKKLLEKGDGDVDICAFVGKVAYGLGESVVGNESFELVAQVHMVGQGENVVDIYLNRPKKKPVASLYLGKNGGGKPALFALFNTHGVPRYLANEVVEEVEGYIKSCNRLLVFHSDISAYYQSSSNNCERQVFHIANSALPKDERPSTGIPLTPPNVIGGISAALLTYAEMRDKPALLLATYGENEIVDSISLKPFLSVIKQNISKSIFSMFAPLQQNLTNCLKKSVTNPVAISNLYI